MGRLKHYDSIMAKYPTTSLDDPIVLKRIVKKLWVRCFKTHNTIATLM